MTKVSPRLSCPIQGAGNFLTLTNGSEGWTSPHLLRLSRPDFALALTHFAPLAPLGTRRACRTGWPRLGVRELAGFAIVAGGLSAWAIITQVMGVEWQFSGLIAVATALVALTVTIAAGLVTTWSALRANPARVLRVD